MTDPTDPTDQGDAVDDLDDLDDLASAHIDGLTTGAEAARIATDPDLARRVEQLAAVRAAVGAEVEPVDETRREQALAAALEAFDAPGAAAEPLAADAPSPVRLADRRRQTQRRLRLVGAAAAIALLAVAVPLLSSMGSDDDSADDLAATALDDDADARQEGAGGAAADEATGDLATPQVAGPEAFATADLGSFDDIPALTRSVQALLARGGDAAPTTTAARSTEDSSTTDGGSGVAGSAACVTDPERGAIVLSTIADLDGRPVVVMVHEQPTGALELVVVDAADCSLVDARPL